MKKSLMLGAAALVCAIPLQAASAGPDAAGYSATSVPFSFIEDTGSATWILTDDDDASVTVPLGFSFSFYGASYTDVSLAPNGLMSFYGLDGTYSNYDVSTSDHWGPAILPLWNDWVTWMHGADAVLVETIGTTFVATWQLVSRYSGSEDSVIFQAVLNGADGSIQYNYLDATGPGMGDATVGITDYLGASSGRNLVLNHDGFGPFAITDESSILITAGDPVPEVQHYAGMLGAALAGAQMLRRRRKA